MKKITLLFTMLFLVGFSWLGNAQSVVATYSAGDIPTNDGSYDSTCNGTATPLVVTLPAGSWDVLSVDVVYDMTAGGGGWMSEQQSQIGCQETGNDEGGYSSGSGGTGGTFNYSRTGLTIANGIHSGNLTFEMKAYRTWAGTAGCNTSVQKIDDGTWTITVNYQPIPSCISPSNLVIDDIQQTTADLHWDGDVTASGFNWEVVLAGTGQGAGNGITGTTVGDGSADPDVNDASVLTSSTDYELWVQADCGGSGTSAWIGPVAFTTLMDPLTNPSACGLGLAIADASCPTNDIFEINVAAAPGTQLGTDVILTDVNLTIAHTWDGDLQVRLTSPNNVTVDLTISNGNGDDNYGDPADGTCALVTNFNMSGVDGAIGSGAAPFIGSFIPDGNFADYNDNSSPIGLWNIEICDNAGGDTGTLEYFEMVFAAPPACLAPTSLSATPTSSTSSNLGWTENNSPASSTWDVEWGAVGFVQGTGTTVIATTNPKEITGLVARNSYDFYVRTDCGGGSKSDWSGPFTWVQPDVGDDCALPIVATVEVDCSVATPTTLDFANAIAEELTSCDGFGNFGYWIEITAPASGAIKITNTGTDIGMSIYTACGTADVFCLNNNLGTELSISGFTPGNAYYFYFWRDDASGTADICFEDITCPFPTNLSHANIAETSVELSWDLGNTETAWNVQYGAPGFDPNVNAGTTVAAATNVSFLLSGLNIGTDYEWYVQADCGGGDESAWFGPDAFTTLYPVPANNDFADAEALPVNSNCVNTLGTLNGATASGETPFGTCGSTDGTEVDVWYSFVGPANGNIEVTTSVGTGANLDTVIVLYSYDAGTLTLTQVQCNDDGVAPFSNISITDGSLVTGDTYYVNVHEYNGDNTDDFNICVVNITCLEPTAMASSNLDKTSVDLDWTVGDTEMDWEIVYDVNPYAQPANGIADASGEPNYTQVNTTPALSLSGLTAGTTYDLYYRADCGGGSYSDWVTYTFTTLPPPLTNPSACGLGLAIADASCPTNDIFEIDVTTAPGTALGIDALLSDVKLIINHTWDADLEVRLTSPNNVTVDLTIGNGSSGDNYGDIVGDPSCDTFTNFNMTGVDGTIGAGTAPFIGSFIPDGDFVNFEDGSSPIGIWKLEICDDAGGDTGTLEFIELVFGANTDCGGVTTTWFDDPLDLDPPAWSNGVPDITKPAIIDFTYNTENDGDIDACSLLITANGDITVPQNSYVNVVNNIVNNGLFLVEEKGSVVQVDDNATVLGDPFGFDVEVKTTDLVDADRFTYFGSPTKDQDLSIFANFNHVWDFNEATQYWNFVGFGPSVSGLMPPSKGYAVRAAAAHLGVQVIDFAGQFNNGVFTQPLVLDVGQHEPTTVAGDDDATLVSNPYPSGLQITGPTGLIAANTINEVLIWTHASLLDTGATSGWAGDDYIVCSSGVCANAPTGGTHTGVVASGQGFFVNATAAGTLTFDNSMRTKTGNDQFRDLDSDVVWLSLSNSIGYHNQIAITFTNNGSENFDSKFDARKPYSTNYGMSFYALNNEGKKLAIEDRGIFTNEIIVPVGFILNDENITDFTLSIDNIQNLEDVDVYVKDNLLNTTYDLRVSDYTFDTTATGENNERFEIIFSRSPLSINNEVVNNDSLVVSNESETQIKVNMLDGSVITNFKAFDVLGKLLIDMKPNANNFIINTNIKQGQVLFIEAKLENGQVLSNKFMKL